MTIIIQNILSSIGFKQKTDTTTADYRRPGPFANFLKACEDMNRFKTLDPDLQRDVGLTQDDVDRAKLSAFLKTPKR